MFISKLFWEDCFQDLVNPGLNWLLNKYSAKTTELLGVWIHTYSLARYNGLHGN